MKKFLLTLFALICVTMAKADDVMLTKCYGDNSYPGFGSKYGSTVQAAEQYTVEELMPYVGGKINKLRVCFYIWPEGQVDKDGQGNNTQVTDIELWIKRNVQDEECLRSIHITQPEGEEEVWVEVELDEPLEIEENMPIALGYTYVQDNTNPPAWFMVLGGDDAFIWMDSGDGSGWRERDLWHLCMEANVTGLDFSVPRAEVTGLTFDSPYYAPGSKKVKTTVTYRNLGPELKNVTIEYAYNGTTKTTKVNAKLGFNTSYERQITITAPDELSDNVDVTARIIAINDVPYDGKPLTASYGLTTQMYPRTMVVEEATGNWCQWCVRGFVAMEQMHRKYPDTFIGIAVHGGGDPMQLTGYINNMYISGFPGCNVNRMPSLMSVGVSPTDFEDYYKTVTGRQTYLDFELEARIEDGKILAKTSGQYEFSRANIDLRMVYVLIEDGVTGYPQANAYAGGSVVMGGYENKPARIDDQVYNEVARGIYPNYYGDEGSFASSIVKGQTYSNELEVALPTNIQNKDNLTLVALLIDGETGEIEQAHKVRLQDVTGVTDLNANSADERWYTIDGIQIDAPTRAGIYVRGGKCIIVK